LHRGYIQWNLTELHPTTVTLANLTLEMSSDGTAGRTINMHALNEDDWDSWNWNNMTPDMNATVIDSETTDGTEPKNYTFNVTSRASLEISEDDYLLTLMLKDPATLGSDLGIYIPYNRVWLYLEYSNPYPFVNVTAYSEDTLANITFNVTMSNSTDSLTFNDQTNVYKYWNDTDVPNGYVTFLVSSDGYSDATYYDTISQTANTTLNAYLVSTGDSLLVRFHILDFAGNSIVNAYTRAYKVSGGEQYLVGERYSDGSGVASINLNPFSTYIIAVTHSSYTSLNTTIQPTSQDYTITLSGESQEPAEEELTNITYSIRPTGGISATNTTFSFTINSFDSKLEWFAFNVTYNGTQLFSNNLTTSSGGNITTTQDLSALDWNYTIITYASFKKLNVTDPFYINTSYYFYEDIEPSGLVDMISIANYLKDTVGVDTQPVMKFFFGIGIIFLSVIVSASVTSQGSGMLALIVMGIGVVLGLLTFTGAGGGLLVFGILCLGFVAVMFLKGGV